MAVVMSHLSLSFSLPAMSSSHTKLKKSASNLLSSFVAPAHRTHCRDGASCTSVNWHQFPLGTSARCLRVFAQEPGIPSDVPDEVLEDPKFARIRGEDPCFGPPALLLLGFSTEDVHKVHKLITEIDGEFMQVLLCTELMLSYPLGTALYADQSEIGKVKPADGLPRMCFISGLTGEEMLMLIDAFPQAGIEKPIFAGHVPNNTMKNLSELIDEILGDHERLSRARQPLQA